MRPWPFTSIVILEHEHVLGAEQSDRCSFVLHYCLFLRSLYIQSRIKTKSKNGSRNMENPKVFDFGTNELMHGCRYCSVEG
jgi:hypothetical protein